MNSNNEPIVYTEDQLITDIKDVFEIMIKRIICLLSPPYGLMAVGVWDFVAKRKQRRINAYMTSIIKALENHRGIAFASASDPEEIIDILESIAINAISTNNQEKLLYYRNLFINSCAKKTEIEHGEIEMFSQMIKEMTPISIEILKLFFNREKIDEEQLKRLRIELGVDETTIAFYCQWLVGRGLLGEKKIARHLNGISKPPDFWYPFEDLYATNHLFKLCTFIFNIE